MIFNSFTSLPRKYICTKLPSKEEWFKIKNGLSHTSPFILGNIYEIKEYFININMITGIKDLVYHKWEFEISESNGKLYNCLTSKKVIKKYFTSLAEYRNQQIDEILK